MPLRTGQVIRPVQRDEDEDNDEEVNDPTYVGRLIRNGIIVVTIVFMIGMTIIYMLQIHTVWQQLLIGVVLAIIGSVVTAVITPKKGGGSTD